MPTYKPLGVKVHLVTCDLAAATTASVQRAKHESMEGTRKAEEALLTGRPLTEAHVPCLEDKTRLHFLGSVPFYLVQAGGDLFTSKEPTLAERVKALTQERELARTAATQHERDTIGASSSSSVAGTSGNRTSTPAGAEIPPVAPSSTKATTPQALGLKITLSSNLFDSRFYRDRAHPTAQQRHCIKYDVYFNGELAASNFQHARSATEKAFKVMSLENGNICIVAGKRTDILLERPWVIVPPGRRADGSIRNVNGGIARSSGAEDRWKAIGRELSKRADERGYNKPEERSPSGRYLADLAGMEMPEALADIQQSDGPSFGVIDVIITNGSGHKSCPTKHWLSKPEPLRDPNYKQMPAGWVPSSSKKAALHRESTEAITADPPNSNLKGMTSTAAFSRERRSTTVPASYRVAAPRKTRQSTSEASSATATPSELTLILPPFPPTPQIDFNDAISITPTKAEEARRNRGEQDGSPLAKTTSRASSARKMLPPLIIPRSAQAKRRRSSGTIDLSSSSASPVEPTVRSTRPGAVSGSKSVSGYMGMTKRGIFSRGVKESKPQFGSMGPAANGGGGPAGEEPSISRVVISSGDSAVVDRQLTSPHKLRSSVNGATDPQHAGAKHQPLDESVLFGPRSIKHVPNAAENNSHVPNMVPTPPTSSQPAAITSTAPPIPTPLLLNTQVQGPSSIPATSQNTPKPQPSLAKPSPRPKLSVHEQIVADERAKWQTPELSKDCVITYAEEGEWLEVAEGKGSILRQVKGAWSGEFSEQEVVFAVRFIVAAE